MNDSHSKIICPYCGLDFGFAPGSKFNFSTYGEWWIYTKCMGCEKEIYVVIDIKRLDFDQGKIRMEQMKKDVKQTE